MVLDTYAENTWCPGCGNFGILNATKNVINKNNPKNTVITGGIGCHAKIMDYIDVSSFYGLHGRAIPPAEGIKLANPNLNVMVFVGDGDTYAEGISHLIFAAKRNSDITVVVHDNRVYALTTGQFTPTSPFGFKGKSTPFGSKERPINPLKLLLNAGATFVARTYSIKGKHMEMVLDKAIKHKGFSYVEILQPCFTFFNTYADYNKRIYEINKPAKTLLEAEKMVTEWDYNNLTSKIPIGIFYQKKEKTFYSLELNNKIPIKRKKVNVKKVI